VAKKRSKNGDSTINTFTKTQAHITLKVGIEQERLSTSAPLSRFFQNELRKFYSCGGGAHRPRVHKYSIVI